MPKNTDPHSPEDSSMPLLSRESKQGEAVPTIRINAKRLLFWLMVCCISIELFFVFCDATINYSHWVDLIHVRLLFNIELEGSFATWFAVTQTFLVALTLWTICLVLWRDKKSRKIFLGWAFLALFFTYLSLDDGARFHENMGSAFKEYHQYKHSNPLLLQKKNPLLKFPSYYWQALFMPFFSAMGLFLLFFLWKQLQLKKQRLFLFFALGCLCIGVTLDFLEGLRPSHPLNVYTIIIEKINLEEFTREQFYEEPYAALIHFSRSLEEFLEMLAMTFFWIIFLSHLIRISPCFQLSFTNQQNADR